MAPLLIVYVFIQMLIIATMFYLAVLCGTKGRAGKTLQPLLVAGTLPMICNIIFLWCKNITVAGIVFGLFSLSIDIVLGVVMLFFVSYMEINFPPIFVIIIGGLLTLMDGVNLLSNNVFGHAYEINRGTTIFDIEANKVASTLTGYRFHLDVCYLMSAGVFTLFIIGIHRASSAYRKKYAGILSAFILMLAIDAIAISFSNPLNISTVAYAIMGITLYSIVIYYSPQRLMGYIQNKILSRMGAGIVCFDEKGHCIFVNDIFWNQLGGNPNQDLLEQTIKDFFDKNGHEEREIKVWERTFEVNGELRYFDIENQNFYDERNRLMGGYFAMSDRTEEKIFYTNQVNDAKKASKQKSDFLSQTSHEIRTPVNAIFGMNEMILRECQDENIRNYAIHIKNGSELLISLINDILDFSKIESGKMELILRSYQPEDLFRDIINMMRVKAKEKKLDFKFKVDSRIPKVLYGDDIRIQQILINIISNAIKYTEEGYVDLNIKWENQGLAVDVTDTGMGIKEENIPILFEAYKRIEEGAVHAIQGTGLGLNITAKLLEYMKGTVNVTSTYGEGSTFSLYIPQTVNSREIIGDFSMEMEDTGFVPYAPSITDSDKKILVVDDNTLNRRIIINFLKKTGIQIDEAASGEACLEKVEQEKYDMILMDHMMPEMDGIETFKRIKQMENNPNTEIPVIMLTANAIAGAKEEYINMGFDDFLSKPVRPEALEKILVKYLQTK